MSLYKRGNVWWVRIQSGGKRYFYSSKTDDKKLAREFEAKIKRDIALDRIGKKEYTLDEIALQWLESAKGQKDYRNSVLNLRHIEPYITGIPVKDASLAATNIIKAFAKLSTATINRRLALLRRFVSIAYQSGYVDSKTSIQLLAGEKHREIYLSRPEVISLAKSSGASKWHIIFLAFTGMRVGEMLNCTVNNGLAHIADSKSGKPRIIPLNKPAQCSWERMKHGRAYRTIWNDFNKATKACGMEGIRLHDLRHTAASWLVQAGANLAVVRDILGHSSLSVTSRYTHLNVSHMKIEMDKM